MGIKIKIIGRKIIIEIIIEENKISHKVIFDRIEAGTYLIAGALLGKRINITKIQTKFLQIECKILKKMGVEIKKTKNSILVSKAKKIKKMNVTTKPYPGFPTDLQAQLMVLMSQANGFLKSMKIFLKIDICMYLN